MYQIFETSWDNEDGELYGQSYSNLTDALREAEYLNEKHEGYVYVVQDIRTKQIYDEDYLHQAKYLYQQVLNKVPDIEPRDFDKLPEKKHV